MRCVEGQTEKIACCSVTVVMPGETFMLYLCLRHTGSCLMVCKTHDR